MLLTLVPIFTPTWAVFALEDGTPDFRAVVSIGLIEVKADQRVAAGFCIGDHFEPADNKPNFVAFTDKVEAAPWMDRCHAKRAEMVQKEADAKKAKLYVPEQPKIAVHA